MLLRGVILSPDSRDHLKDLVSDLGRTVQSAQASLSDVEGASDDCDAHTAKFCKTAGSPCAEHQKACESAGAAPGDCEWSEGNLGGYCMMAKAPPGV